MSMRRLVSAPATSAATGKLGSVRLVSRYGMRWNAGRRRARGGKDEQDQHTENRHASLDGYLTADHAVNSG